MLSSVRVARLLQQQAVHNYQTTVADTVLAVQVAYYDVLLSAQEIGVQGSSVELLRRELADTSRRFEAGTVPRFNVLRAEVELASAQPRLITARNNYRIAKNNLANVLGFNLPREVFEDIPLRLAGKLEDDPFTIELPRALRSRWIDALNLKLCARFNLFGRKNSPRQGPVTYPRYRVMPATMRTTPCSGGPRHRAAWLDCRRATHLEHLDGLRTRGRVVETSANLEKAGIDLEDASRRIELEVRTAFSNFIESREVIESQKKVVEQAEEALRLAQARAEAGTGTQLDVLGAQTSLTQARTTQLQALHGYDVARSRLQRAIGMSLPTAAQAETLTCAGDAERFPVHLGLALLSIRGSPEPLRRLRAGRWNVQVLRGLGS